MEDHSGIREKSSSQNADWEGWIKEKSKPKIKKAGIKKGELWARRMIIIV